MLVVTIDDLPGHEVTEVLGLVRGNVVRTKHVGQDLVAGLRNLVGGEVSEYTSLMAGAREQALDRMIGEARDMGADAIIGVRFTTSMIQQGAAELLVVGTAVRVAKTG